MKSVLLVLAALVGLGEIELLAQRNRPYIPPPVVRSPGGGGGGGGVSRPAGTPSRPRTSPGQPRTGSPTGQPRAGAPSGRTGQPGQPGYTGGAGRATPRRTTPANGPGPARVGSGSAAAKPPVPQKNSPEVQQTQLRVKQRLEQQRLLLRRQLAAKRQKLRESQLADDTREREKEEADNERRERARMTGAVGGFVDGRQLTRRPANEPAVANDVPANEEKGPKARPLAIVTQRPKRALTASEAANAAQTQAEWARIGRYPPNDGFEGKKIELLNKGARISRYGVETGGYSSPAEAPFEGRGLPPSARNIRPKVYEVLRTLPVLAGKASDVKSERSKEVWKGGATQYLHTKSIEELIEEGYLREATEPEPASTGANDNSGSRR